MSNYTPITDFASKDALLAGDPNKIIKGTEFTAEFDAINTAVASKADSSSANAFTAGATSVTTLTTTGNVTLGDASTDTVTVNGYQFNAAGAAATPSISRTGDANTGLWFPAADTIAASTGGSERLRIDSAGNVGIGTSSPTFADGSGLEIERDGSTATIRLQRITTSPSSMEIRSGANTGEIIVTSASPLILGTSGAERLRIDSAGNMALGTTPSAGWSAFKAIDLFGSTGGAVGSTNGSISQSINTYYDGANWIYKGNGYATRYEQLGGNAGTSSHAWYTAPSGIAGNAVTFTQSLAVGLGKTLALEGATSATGTGIAFPATQVASSNANTLDDYEEGTWTPSLGGTATYTVQVGTYTKVGRKVTATGTITVNAIGTGSTFNIAGLPFATANLGHNFNCLVGYRATAASSVTQLVGSIGAGGTTIDLYSSTAASGTVATNAIFQAGTRVDFTTTYFTA